MGLDVFRKEIDNIDDQITLLLRKRKEIVNKVKNYKEQNKIEIQDINREREILNRLINKNNNFLEDEFIRKIFKLIFEDSRSIQNKKEYIVKSKQIKKIILDNCEISQNNINHVFGPCSVESYTQLEAVAKVIKSNNLNFIRAGAFKPRTSPYDFQGLGEKGLEIIKNISDKYGLKSVSEIVDPRHFEIADEYIDIFQIGARNMSNFELLKEAGKTNKPILLKRGLSATIGELINSAEYIAKYGNDNIILCERGIRTYEPSTRNTLDISSIPILKNETNLPIFADVTHSSGRKDIMLPLANACLSAGANGIMAEVHPCPHLALSDSHQQMNIKEFELFYNKLFN